MKFLINLFLKFSGASWVWKKMDGYKMYGTGALACLGALFGLGTELAPLLAAHDAGALWAFFTHVNSDPNWMALLAGFGLIAKAHKDDKTAAAAAPAPAAPPAA